MGKLISVADHGFCLFRDPNRMRMDAVDTEHKSNDDNDNEKKSTSMSYKNSIVCVGNSSRWLGPPPGLNENKHKKGGRMIDFIVQIIVNKIFLIGGQCQQIKCAEHDKKKIKTKIKISKKSENINAREQEKKKKKKQKNFF